MNKIFIKLNSIKEFNLIQQYYLDNGYKWVYSGYIKLNFEDLLDMIVVLEQKTMSRTTLDEQEAIELYGNIKVIDSKQIMRKIKLDNIEKL